MEHAMPYGLTYYLNSSPYLYHQALYPYKCWQDLIPTFLFNKGLHLLANLICFRGCWAMFVNFIDALFVQ